MFPTTVIGFLQKIIQADPSYTNSESLSLLFISISAVLIHWFLNNFKSLEFTLHVLQVLVRPLASRFSACVQPLRLRLPLRVGRRRPLHGLLAAPSHRELELLRRWIDQRGQSTWRKSRRSFLCIHSFLPTRR